jgi:hypothetical protein
MLHCGYFQVVVFWVLAPCILAVGYQRFGGPLCFHLHSSYFITTRRQIPKRSRHELSRSQNVKRGCIQKFPDRIYNEVYAYNNKHSFRSNKRIMKAKFTRLTHEIALQLHLVAQSCTICSSRSRRPVQKLLDTPSYVCMCVCVCVCVKFS